MCGVRNISVEERLQYSRPSMTLCRGRCRSRSQVKSRSRSKGRRSKSRERVSRFCTVLTCKDIHVFCCGRHSVVWGKYGLSLWMTVTQSHRWRWKPNQTANSMEVFTFLAISSQQKFQLVTHKHDVPLDYCLASCNSYCFLCPTICENQQHAWPNDEQRRAYLHVSNLHIWQGWPTIFLSNTRNSFQI